MHLIAYEGKSERELKARTEAEVMEKHCLLASSACSLLQPRSGTTHNRLDLLTSNMHQENAPTDLPTVQSDGCNSSVEVLSLQKARAVSR